MASRMFLGASLTSSISKVSRGLETWDAENLSLNTNWRCEAVSRDAGHAAPKKKTTATYVRMQSHMVQVIVYIQLVQDCKHLVLNTHNTSVYG